MIKFLLKGIVGDKNRSVLPILIITIGVMLTIFLSGYLRGVMGDMIDQNARFETGHVKVMSRAYAENISQMPNDLALLGVDDVNEELRSEFPQMHWVERIKFGGLVDVPDLEGGSKGQGPAGAIALDLFNPESGEDARMNISSSLVQGRMPSQPREVLIGEEFADKINVAIGDEITYMGSTMNGSMTFSNFIVSGMVHFGVSAMDKGTLLVDISDARLLLDMEDAVGEILGYFPDNAYNQEKAFSVANTFNSHYVNIDDEYAPVMMPLSTQNNLGSYLDYVDIYAGMFVFIFVAAMSVVLWNTGLLGGLRRYQEFGIRLALGESKGHIYRTLILEAILIGFIGSVLGTIVGLAGVYTLQVVGFDIGDMLKENTMMVPSVIRAKVTPDLFYIGFIPGLIAMVLGNALSGIGIYKRSTASLFKELEV